MPVLGEDSFDAAVKKVMRESDVDEESAKRIVGSIEKKKRLAKLRLAAIGIEFTDPEVRRNRVQDFKKKYNPDSLPDNPGNITKQDRVEQEVNYINTGEKIRPKGTSATILPDIRRKMAQDHHHSIVFRSQKIGKGIFRAASLVDQSGRYAKYWLLNAKQTNGNGWGISAKTAKENMQKFVGRPFVITSSKWHGAS